VVLRREDLTTGRQERLVATLWTSDRPPRGIVIVVHGLGDHSGRFAALAETLVQYGWGVLAFDLPGHGRSPEKRGRIGRFSHVLADIEHARQTVVRRFPALPQVILGHSMGGNLAINYVLRRAEWSAAIADNRVQPMDRSQLDTRNHEPSYDPIESPIRGLILLAPMLLPPDPPPRPIIFAAWLTGHMLPWLCLRRPADLSKLTRDADEAAMIRADELMHSHISIYLATQLLSQGRWALDHARSIDVRTLIMYGETDSLIDTSACEHLALRIGELATRITFPEMRHDLLHDLQRHESISQIVAWLEGI